MSKQFSGKQGLVHRPHRSRTTATGLFTIGWFLLQSLVPVAPALADAVKEDELTYGEFLEKIDQGQVEQVDIDQERGIAYVTLEGDPEDADPHEVMLFTGDRNPELSQKLRDNQVDVGVKESSGSGALAWLATNSLLALILIFGLLLIP